MIIYVYQLVHLDHIFHYHICYTKKLGIMRILQLSQHNGNFTIVLLYNIYNDCVCISTGSPGSYFSLSYMLYKKLGIMRILQLSQHNGKLSLPRQKQGNYPVIPIYACEVDYFHCYINEFGT